jgi:hypothetical protein
MARKRCRKRPQIARESRTRCSGGRPAERHDAAAACGLRPRSVHCAARAVTGTGPVCDATGVSLRLSRGCFCEIRASLATPSAAAGSTVLTCTAVGRTRQDGCQAPCLSHLWGRKVRTAARARPQLATAEARLATNLRRLLPLIAQSRPAHGAADRVPGSALRQARGAVGSEARATGRRRSRRGLAAVPQKREERAASAARSCHVLPGCCEGPLTRPRAGRPDRPCRPAC